MWRIAAITVIGVILLLLVGCAADGVDRRIHLGASDQLVVSRSTHRTSNGAHINDYTCQPLTMICDGFGDELVCYCGRISIR